MTKIRCQICGCEELHTENDVFVVCNNCNNKTVVIPERAIVAYNNPVDDDFVMIKYNKKALSCPKKSFCLNDTMEFGAKPCETCNVVERKIDELTNEILQKFEERQQLINAHPEFSNK